MDRGRSLDASPASSRSSSGWFQVLHENLRHQKRRAKHRSRNPPAGSGEIDARHDNDLVVRLAVEQAQDQGDQNNQFTGTSSASSSGPREAQEAPLTNVERHKTGSCDPCVFWAAPVGCSKGDACRYCHLLHKSKVKIADRPRKQTRDKLKAELDQLLNQNQDLDFEDLHDILQAQARKSPYLRKLLEGLEAKPGLGFERPAAASRFGVHAVESHRIPPPPRPPRIYDGADWSHSPAVFNPFVLKGPMASAGHGPLHALQ